jgi:hypothetical protein
MKINRFLLRSLFPAALVFSACACSTDPDIQRIQQVLGSSAEAPVFLECRPLSADEITFQFSRPVKVVSLALDPAVDVESVENGEEVRVRLAAPLTGGEKFTADILVEDEDRNTLNVLVPFRARNDRMPSLVINEVRTEYSKPKVEFVELKTLSGGDMGAIRLFIAGYSISRPVYEFSPGEVKAGEYIVLHLRTIEEGLVDETGEDLSLSPGTEALAAARDFWVSGSEKFIHKTDAVYLLDQDDSIIDGVLLSENQDPWWTKPDLAAAAELFASQGAWFPVDDSGNAAAPEDGWIPTPGDAVRTAGTTLTRTICRDETAENSGSAAGWYITATSNATPGKENSSKKYVK